MEPVEVSSLPSRVTVAELLSSRYSTQGRPLRWEDRQAGCDVVRLEDGRVIRLRSTGGQSPPNCGWTLVLTEGGQEGGYCWTLYGLPAAEPVPV